MAFLGNRPPASKPMTQETQKPTQNVRPTVQNCPHCGKDINTPPADTDNGAIIQHYIDQIEDQRHHLTKWEEEFFDSVAERFSESGKLSPKQVAILRRIYDEKVGS